MNEQHSRVDKGSLHASAMETGGGCSLVSIGHTHCAVLDAPHSFETIGVEAEVEIDIEVECHSVKSTLCEGSSVLVATSDAVTMAAAHP